MLFALASTLLLASSAAAAIVVSPPAPQSPSLSADVLPNPDSNDEPDSSPYDKRDGKTCFALEARVASPPKAIGLIRLSTIGELRLGGSFPQGAFCLDDQGVLKDSRGLNCFMNQRTQQFQCFQGLESKTTFAIKDAYLSEDGTREFFICPANDGGRPPSWNIFSGKMTPKKDCWNILLGVKDPVPGTAEASLSGSDEANQDDDEAPSQIDPHNVRVGTPKINPRTMPFCNISPDAPFLSPKETSSGVGIELNIDSDGKVSINTTMDAIFEFEIPSSFVEPSPKRHPGGRLCALQFRFPACTDLPEGYPCFEWSGMEQQYSRESGMAWRKVSDTLDANDWEGDHLVQVTPGNRVTVGQFACGVDTTKQSRKISWLVKSVNDWSLDFSQAGVGSQDEWDDGVGAFVVACD